MIEIENPLTKRPLSVQRVLGTYTQSRPGPTLIVIVGIHGNEPSGVIAAQSVLSKLHECEPEMHGRLLVVVGNLPALAAQVRYLDEDMNRIWTAQRVETSRQADHISHSEEKELLEVLEVLDAQTTPQESYFLDCHSTSSESVPYLSCVQHTESLRLAGEIPLFTVIGATSELSGVSDHYLIQQGYRGFTFEAGQHDRLSSIENQQAIMWTMLHRVGCLGDPPAAWQAVLAKSQLDGPRYFRLQHAHPLQAESDFKMEPGFFNFQRVRAGDLLAWEGGQPVTAPCDGRIYLPLYQPTGDEGFSIIQQVE